MPQLHQSAFLSPSVTNPQDLMMSVSADTFHTGKYQQVNNPSLDDRLQSQFPLIVSGDCRIALSPAGRMIMQFPSALM